MKIASFYNIFFLHFIIWNALVSVRIQSVETSDCELIKEDPETLALGCDVIAGDISAKSPLDPEAGIEGIYFQPRSNERAADEEEYRKFIEPSSIAVLEAAMKLEVSISFLSVCGLKGLAMKVELFKDYQLKS